MSDKRRLSDTDLSSSLGVPWITPRVQYMSSFQGEADEKIPSHELSLLEVSPIPSR